LIQKKTDSFSRKLGAPIGSLLIDIETSANALGKQIGGKKGTAVTKKILRKILIDIALVQWTKKLTNTSLSTTSSPEFATPRSAEECILELFELDGVNFESIMSTSSFNDEKEDTELDLSSDNEVSIVIIHIFPTFPSK